MRDGLRNILLGTLLSLLLTKNDGMIYCAEVVSWSWKKFWKSLFSRTVISDTLIGVTVGVIAGSKQLFQGNLSSVLSTGVSTGLLIAIGIHLVSAILQGVASNTLSNHDRSVPNEGIKRSLFYGMLSFMIGTVIASLFTILTTTLFLVVNYGPAVLRHMSKLQSILHTGLLISLLLGPIGGLLAALLLGWLAGWQHTLLRLILRITGNIPLKLSPFWIMRPLACYFVGREGATSLFIAPCLNISHHFILRSNHLPRQNRLLDFSNAHQFPELGSSAGRLSLIAFSPINVHSD